VKFTLADIEAALEKGLELAVKLAPLAGLGGPAAAAIGTTIGNLAATADEILKSIEGDAAIIASGDLTKIRALQKDLQAQNKALNAEIEDS
jgi:hypothetical protein